MTSGEIVFFSFLFIGSMIIATEFAKYGILEIGIQRPINQGALNGMVIGLITFTSGSVMHFITGFNPTVDWKAAFFVSGIPLLWIPFFRYFILKSGLADFNRAKIRTNYWMIDNYKHGEILEKEGNNLRDFYMAKSAIKMFEKAIKAQEKGITMRTASKKIEINDDLLDYYRENICFSCPVCPDTLRIPVYADLAKGMNGPCNLCGSIISVRRIGNTLYVSAYLNKPIKILTDNNKSNIAVTYAELAMLYRMMNLFNEAIAALDEAKKIIKELIEKDPTNNEYLSNLSLINFRRSEIYHAQGNKIKAGEGYKECISLDLKLEDKDGVRICNELLQKI